MHYLIINMEVSMKAFSKFEKKYLWALLLMAVCTGPAYSDGGPFPTVDDAQVNTFAGNWEVVLRDEEGQVIQNYQVTMEPPLKRDFERHKPPYYTAKNTSGALDNWSVICSGTNVFSRDYELSGSQMKFSHGYGIIGHWGANSTLSFSGDKGVGGWSYGEESGSEEWTRLRAKVDRVEFGELEYYTGDFYERPAVSSVAYGQSVEVKGKYERPYWSASNNFPGQRPHFYIKLYGENLSGYHFVDIDDSTGFDLGISEFKDGSGSGVAIWLSLWPGMSNGPKTLYFDDLEIPFVLSVEGLDARMRKVEVLTDMTDGYEKIAGERHVKGGITERLYGESQTVRLLIKLSDYEWTLHGSPEFTDPNGEIDYRLVSMLREGDEANHRERVALFKEWGIAAGRGANDPELMLVHAYVPAGSASNFKAIQYHKDIGFWGLLYSNLGASLQFARERMPNDWQPAYFGMVGDRLRLEMIFTEDPKLPEIPLWQTQAAGDLSGIELPLSQGHRIILKRTDDPKVYASGTIAVGATAFPMQGNSDWSDVEHVVTIPPPTGGPEHDPIDSRVGDLLVSLDVDYRAQHFIAPVAPMVKSSSIVFPVYTAPPDPTLWQDAVTRTIKCLGSIDMDGQTIDGLPSLRKGEIMRASINSLGFYVKTWAFSYAKADSMKAVLDPTGITTAASDVKTLWDAQPMMPKAYVSVGHHAALLLLRDELLRQLSSQIEDLQRIGSNYGALIDELEKMPYSEDSAFNLVAIQSPSSEAMEFRELQWGDRWLTERTGATGDALKHWKRREMKRVIDGLIVAGLDAQRDIVQMDKCESKALLSLVGDVHGPITAKLIPRLVKPMRKSNGQSYWVTDKAAISWVYMVHDLANEVKARNKEADIDNKALLFQAAAASILLGPGVPSVVGDLVVASTEFAQSYADFLVAQEKFAVDRGKALVMGVQYYRQAEALAEQAQKNFEQSVLMGAVGFGLGRVADQLFYGWRTAVGLKSPKLAKLPSLPDLGPSALAKTERILRNTADDAPLPATVAPTKAVDPNKTLPLPAKNDLPPTKKLPSDETEYVEPLETRNFETMTTKPVDSDLPPTKKLPGDETEYVDPLETRNFETMTTKPVDGDLPPTKKLPGDETEYVDPLETRNFETMTTKPVDGDLPPTKKLPGDETEYVDPLETRNFETMTTKPVDGDLPLPVTPKTEKFTPEELAAAKAEGRPASAIDERVPDVDPMKTQPVPHDPMKTQPVPHDPMKTQPVPKDGSTGEFGMNPVDPNAPAYKPEPRASIRLERERAAANEAVSKPFNGRESMDAKYKAEADYYRQRRIENIEEDIRYFELENVRSKGIKEYDDGLAKLRSEWEARTQSAGADRAKRTAALEKDHKVMDVVEKHTGYRSAEDYLHLDIERLRPHRELSDGEAIAGVMSNRFKSKSGPLKGTPEQHRNALKEAGLNRSQAKAEIMKVYNPAANPDDVAGIEAFAERYLDWAGMK
jgi:hypothetical protein